MQPCKKYNSYRSQSVAKLHWNKHENYKLNISKTS